MRVERIYGVTVGLKVGFGVTFGVTLGVADVDATGVGAIVAVGAVPLKFPISRIRSALI